MISLAFNEENQGVGEGSGSASVKGLTWLGFFEGTNQVMPTSVALKGF